MTPITKLFAGISGIFGSDSNTQRRMMNLSLAARRKVVRLVKLEERNREINAPCPRKRHKPWRFHKAANPYALRTAQFKYRYGLVA